MSDYHDLVNIDTPKEERDKFNVGPYYINAAKCLKCGDTIRSKDKRDYVYCKCGNLSVDGGSWHLSRSYKEENTYKDLSVKFNDNK